MISSIYAKAYTEVLEIIKYFPVDEFNKIPEEKIDFYKNNMDKNYFFKINPEIDLSNQNISPEANAIIVSLFRDYYATEEQKNKIEEILELNQAKEEYLKKELYNPDDIFKKLDNNNNNIDTIATNKNNTTLIEYNETLFIKFKKFILKIFSKNK